MRARSINTHSSKNLVVENFSRVFGLQKFFNTKIFYESFITRKFPDLRYTPTYSVAPTCSLCILSSTTHVGVKAQCYLHTICVIYSDLCCVLTCTMWCPLWEVVSRACMWEEGNERQSYCGFSKVHVRVVPKLALSIEFPIRSPTLYMHIHFSRISIAMFILSPICF